MKRTLLTSAAAFLVVLASAAPAQANIFEDVFGGGEPAAPTIQSDKADYAPGETVTLTGSNWKPGETVTLYINDEDTRTWDKTDTVQVDDNGDLYYQFDIPYWFVASYSVQATGDQGSVAVTSFTDAGKPPASAISGPGDGLSYNATTFAGCASTGQICGTASGSGLDLVQIQIKRNSDNRFWSGSSWSTTATWLSVTGTTSWTYSFASSNLANATTYTVTSRASAGASVESAPPTVTFTYDTAAPDTTLSSPPSGNVFSTSQSFTFSSPDATAAFECKLDAGAWTACTSPRSYTGLSAGSHTFSVRAKDPAGNVDATPATATWTVVIDSTPPDTTITSQPADPSSDTAPTFTFTSSEAGSTFECRLDAKASDPWVACSSPYTTPTLTAGSHKFEVRARDQAGNVDGTPAVDTWTVDTTAPTTTISSKPASLINTSSATVAFSSEANATFECKLDAGAWAACTSPRSYTALSDGSHTISVRATDAAGNVEASPATATFTVDTVAPSVSISSGPNAPTTSTSASFAFSSADAGATFECKYDGLAWEPCTSPKTYTGLTDGPQTFSVRATDAAGNTGTAANRNWSVDITAPDTTISSKPAANTTSTSADFTFTSEAGATVECSLDGAAWASCTSPQSYTRLAEGSHTFQVRAKDALGNTDATPASFTWTIDRTDPNTTITDAPAGGSGSSSATFAFSSNEAGGTFECRLDGNGNDPWDSCSSPKTYSGLAGGSHRFEVRAIDSAGNVDGSPATHSWSTDLTPPETAIDSGPAGTVTSNSATFTFSSEPGATFECKYDGLAWEPCSSPKSYTGLADGTQTFRVRATDTAGNTDASPAQRNWTIDTTAPDVSFVVSPLASTESTSASFSYQLDDPQGTSQCKLNGASYVDCSGSKSFSSLAVGTHTFYVKTRDALGNTRVKTYTWDVTTSSNGVGDPATECSTAFGSGYSGFKIDGVSLGALAGEYQDPASGLDVVITSADADNTFDYASSFAVKVLVKGGSGDPEQFPLATAGTNLHPPLNTSTSKPNDYYGISHITFCWIGGGGDTGGGGDGGGDGGGGGGGGGGGTGGGGGGIGSPAYECQTQFGEGYIGFKLDSVNEKYFDGTYRDAYSGLKIGISNTDSTTHTFDFVANWPVRVIGKGGSGDPQLYEDATSGQGLHPPENTSTSKEGDWYGISHVTFCWIPGGTLKVKKHVTPATPEYIQNRFDFTWQTADAATQEFDLADSESMQIIPPAGNYDFSEVDIPDRWKLTDISCSNTAGGEPWSIENPDASIDLANGDSVLCEFYNRVNSAITVRKETLPDGASDLFDFTLASTDEGTTDENFSLADGEEKTFFVDPGSYGIAEGSLPSDWSLSGVECVDRSGEPVDGVVDESSAVAATLELDQDLTCTFTNDLSKGSITIEKVGLPEGASGSFDFSLTGPDDFSESVQVETGDKKVIPVDPGTYTATETASWGWDLTDLSCSDPTDNTSSRLNYRDATIEVNGDENIDCVFTNTQQLGTITVEKQTKPDGASDSFDFSLKSSGSGGTDEEFQLTDDETKKFTLSPGEYDLGETLSQEWQASGIVCDDQQGDSSVDRAGGSASLDLANGEDIYCTFTNDLQQGSVVIEKQTLPDGVARSFGFTGPNGETFQLGDGERKVFKLAPGGYEFAELASEGWDLASLECSDPTDDSSAAVQSAEASVALADGETVECVFTNDRQEGTIRISKDTVPAGAEASFDFESDIPGGSTFAVGGGSSKVFEVDPGVYEVSELAAEGWDLKDIECSDDGSSTNLPLSQASIDVAPGEDVTCVFTNDIQQGTITVSKETNPDGSDRNFSFSLQQQGGGLDERFSLRDGGSKTFTVPVGTFDLTEAAVAGWGISGITCSDESSGSTETGVTSIDVSDGEDVSCTYTNDLEKASIVIEKQTTPDGSSKNFDFQIQRTDSGPALPLSSFQLQDDGERILTVDPGTYSVSEVASTGWQLLDLTCEDPTSDSEVDVDSGTASIDVSAGESVRCSYMNDLKKGSITIEKETDPTGSSKKFAFDVARTDGGAGLSVSSFQIGDGEKKVIPVDNGTYDITERLTEGWALDQLECDDPTSDSTTDLPARNSAITVQDGEDVTCMYSNRELRGSITIVKDTLPDASPQTFDFTGPNGSRFTLADGESKTFEIHQGSYSVTEDEVADWTLADVTCSDDNSTFSAAKNGVDISLQGNEDLTCTFQNNGPRANVTIMKQALPSGTSQAFEFASVALPENNFSLAGGEHKTFIVAPGEYDVTELATEGWEGWDITCEGGHAHSDPSTGTLVVEADNGEDIECTYINKEVTEPPRPRAQITVTKQTDPADTARHFDFSATGPDLNTDFYLGAGESRTFLVDPGQVTLHEADAAGWKLWDINCTDPDAELAIDTNEVTLDLSDGDQVSCVFKNNVEDDKRSGISAIKKLTPTGDSGRFDLKIDDTTYKSGAGHNGSTGWQILQPGLHTVSESAVAGTSLASYDSRITCRNSEEQIVAEGPGPSLQVNLGEGIRLECTVTNVRKGGIKVVKSLSPASNSGRFNLRIDDTVRASSVGDGGSSDWIPVSASETHSVSEVGAGGTSLSDYNSSVRCVDEANGQELFTGSGSSLDLQVEPAQRVICTITNVRKVGSVTVRKTLSPSTNSGRFNLLVDGTVRATSVGDGGTTGSLTVNTGSHTISEAGANGTLLSNYNAGIVCRNAQNTVIAQSATPSVNVNIVESAQVTCTITNTFIDRALKVTKQVVTPDGSSPAADPGRFNLRIQNGSGTLVGSQTGVGHEGTTGWVGLPSGTYTVSELAGTNTNPDLYTSGIVCRNGSGTVVARGTGTSLGGVTLNNTDNVKVDCAITNTRKTGSVKITKKLVPSTDSGRFNLLLNGSALASGVGDGGTTETRIVNTGTYTVSETGVPGTLLGDYASGITCWNAAGAISYGPQSATSLSIAVATGEFNDCIVTNTLIEQPGTTVLEGVQFVDEDKDGRPHEEGEPPLTDWTIFVDLDGDGELGPNEPYGVTGPDGAYKIPGVPPGSFTVRSIPPANSKYNCSFPNTCAWDKSIPEPPPGEVGRAEADFGAVTMPKDMKRGTALSSSPGGCTKETLRVRVMGNAVNRVLFSFRRVNASVDRVHTDGSYVFERSVKGLKRGTYQVSAKAFFSDGSKPRSMIERVFICPKTNPQFTG